MVGITSTKGSMKAHILGDVGFFLGRATPAEEAGTQRGSALVRVLFVFVSLDDFKDIFYLRVKRIRCTELGCISTETGCRGVVNCTSVSGCLPVSMSYS